MDTKAYLGAYIPPAIPKEIPVPDIQDPRLACYNLRMSKLGNFIKSLGERAKSYTGVIAGNLPSSTNWGQTDYLKANDISLYTSRAVAKRAEKVSEVQFVVKNAKGEVIDNHPILKTLNYPNQFYTGQAFWELCQKYIDLVGAAYILKDSNRELFETKAKVTGLHLLKPNNVTPEFNTDGTIRVFRYKTEHGTTEYQPEQVIYIFRPDPSNPLKGLSLLKAGITAIQTEVQISAYHARILENGGKVEGVFKFKTPRITKEQMQNLKDEYTKQLSDARKAGVPLFLGGDAEYSRVGMTPDELSYLEAKKTSLEDICIMTGVPKAILASMDGIQYSNAETSIRVFLRETVVPLLRSLTGALDMALLPDGETLTFVDPTPENVDEKIKVLESGVKSNLLKINEGRRMLARLTGEDLPDVTGGDEILVPFNLIPLGDESVVNNGAGEKKIKGESEDHPLKDEATRKVYGKVQDRRIARKAKPFERQVKTYFKGQEERLIAQLQPEKSRTYRRKGLLEESINLELEVQIGQEQFLPLMNDLVASAGGDAMELVGSSGKFRLSAEVTTWFTQRTDVFLRTINETTYKRLQKEFEASLAAGENRNQLIERVQTTYKSITEARAAMIARTEVHNATQYGTMEGYRQAGMSLKIWVSVGDADTRGSDPMDEADHLSMDGEERPLDMPFSNGLMYPGDPRGSAAETINCRCVI